MKYLKTYEALSSIELNINVVLFPNSKGLKKDKVSTTGIWTVFIGASHNKKVIQKCYDIIWMKYFNKKDPCGKRSLGPCRPEFESFPQELINTLEYLNFKYNINEEGTQDKVIKFKRPKFKIYWKYTDPKKAPIDKDELEITLKFNSEQEALDWLDIFDFSLKGLNKELIDSFIDAKKYNII